MTFWVKRMAELLELNKWRIRLKFDTNDSEEVKAGEAPTTAADCTVEPEYRLVSINFYLDTCDKEDFDWNQYRNTVIHEMLHAWVSILTKYIKDLCKGDPAGRAVLHRLEEALISRTADLDYWAELLPLNPKKIKQ